MKDSSRRATAPRIDIRDVATHARVSIATVSRTINHIPTVNPALAARVWKAVSELNYFPNTQARALVSGKSKLLGLIVSEITNPFFPELIHEFEQVAISKGYEILIGSTNYEPQDHGTLRSPDAGMQRRRRRHHDLRRRGVRAGSVHRGKTLRSSSSTPRQSTLTATHL